MTEIFTAKSIDEAKALAAEKFGKPVSEITFEVLEDAKKGFLGIGKSDAKIKATYEEKIVEMPVFDSAEKEPEADFAQEMLTKPVIAEEIPEQTEETAPVEETVTESAPVEETPVIPPVTEEAPVATDAQEEKTAPADIPDVPEDDELDEYSIEKFTLMEDESLIEPKVKIACDYITSILRAMGVDASFKIYQNETGAIINIESDNNGTIIGRRGETIDSIQYLCSIIANKGDKDYFRITIDCFGYRKKRRETLEQLAAKVAKAALRTGRSQPLEPMNPYERRVIHSAISKIEGVSSRSVGEEPYRKIIISSNNPKKNNRRKPNNDRKGGNNRKRGPRKEPFEPRAIDLSTSFEKDYKKPKPEDNLDTGLYGKIEF